VDTASLALSPAGDGARPHLRSGGELVALRRAEAVEGLQHQAAVRAGLELE